MPRKRGLTGADDRPPARRVPRGQSVQQRTRLPDPGATGAGSNLMKAGVLMIHLAVMTIASAAGMAHAAAEPPEQSVAIGKSARPGAASGTVDPRGGGKVG